MSYSTSPHTTAPFTRLTNTAALPKSLARFASSWSSREDAGRRCGLHRGVEQLDHQHEQQRRRAAMRSARGSRGSATAIGTSTRCPTELPVGMPTPFRTRSTVRQESRAGRARFGRRPTGSCAGSSDPRAGSFRTPVIRCSARHVPHRRRRGSVHFRSCSCSGQVQGMLRDIMRLLAPRFRPAHAALPTAIRAQRQDPAS